VSRAEKARGDFTRPGKIVSAKPGIAATAEILQPIPDV